ARAGNWTNIGVENRPECVVEVPSPRVGGHHRCSFAGRQFVQADEHRCYEAGLTGASAANNGEYDSVETAGLIAHLPIAVGAVTGQPIVREHQRGHASSAGAAVPKHAVPPWTHVVVETVAAAAS